MNGKYLIFIFLVFFGWNVETSAAESTRTLAGLSAKRSPSEHFDYYVHVATDLADSNSFPNRYSSALIERGQFEEADWSRVPKLSAKEMQSIFEIARDKKLFVDAFSHDKKKRRAPWLYPDDGCFMRAAVVSDTIEQEMKIKSAKIFAFGDLTIQTNNSPQGSVSWWYHVAAISKVNISGTDVFYVYDPAIDPKKPMEVRDWLAAMNSPEAEITICAGATYDPNSDCENGDARSWSRAMNDAPGYLSAEWHQLEQMGRDPRRETGDFPPWQ